MTSELTKVPLTNLGGRSLLLVSEFHYPEVPIVSHVTPRLRSFLIAIAVLAISATVALAGRPSVSQQTSLTADRVESPEPSESADPSESPEPSESADPSDAPDASEAPDVRTGASTGHPDNHGKLVSEAAHASTPPGFANHGAYVRTIAHNNHGHANQAGTHGPKTH